MASDLGLVYPSLLLGTKMTEDDTFQKLKKLSWDEAFQKYKEFGEKPISDNDIEEFWEKIGWDETEFHQRWHNNSSYGVNDESLHSRYW